MLDFQVLRQIIALFILWIILKQSFGFFPHSQIGVYKHNDKCGWIQYFLGCPPGSILFLCFSSFLSLLLLSNISNPHAPTLEHANPLEAGQNLIQPILLIVYEYQKKEYTQLPSYFGIDGQSCKQFLKFFDICVLYSLLISNMGLPLNIKKNDGSGSIIL